MMTTRNYRFLIAAMLIVFSISCKTAKPPLASVDLPPPLCGTYVSKKSLYDTLTFTDWNSVEVMTEFIPPSLYYITGDTAVVIPDKSFLLFRIEKANTLKGLGGWVGEGKWRKIPGSDGDCGSASPSSAEEAKEMKQWKSYFELLVHPDYKEIGVERLKELCEAGHAKSCIDYAVFTMDFMSDNPDMTYVQKACEMGFYMGCYRMGELLLRKNRLPEAKPYFEKSCEMGHKASCMSLDLLDFEE